MADLFKRMRQEGHEQLLVSTDPETGMKAIISIHSTVLGPALGGCRVWNYRTFNEAVGDALRLSRAMTYKAAIHGLNLGGGKAVLAIPGAEKTPDILRAFGRMVDSLAGLYFTAEDVGMGEADLDTVREVTRYATGFSERNGGGGDPSPWTALGILSGMRACLREVFQEESFRDRVVAIQGVGKVGGRLADLLAGEGARLVVSDLDRNRAKEVASRVGGKAVSARKIFSEKCDIFSPCALGGTLNALTIPGLRCRIVAGAANNQLDRPSDAKRLAKCKILYAPDFVLNGGGVINISVEMEGYDPEKARQAVSRVGETTWKVLNRARLEKTTPQDAAERMVEERIGQFRPPPLRLKVK